MKKGNKLKDRTVRFTQKEENLKKGIKDSKGR